MSWKRAIAVAALGASIGSLVLLIPSMHAAGQTPESPSFSSAGPGTISLIASASALPGAPPPGQSGPGRDLYLADCAWCHGNDGDGTDRGPSLIGVGAASADFMLSTGRMPIAVPEDNPPRRKPVYDQVRIDALVAYVESLGPSGIPVPSVDPAAGDLRTGASLYEINCAACHSSTGIGGALPQGLEAPSILNSTPVEIAEAMRLGGAGVVSGNMPKFGADQIDQREVDSIVAYILFLQHEASRVDRGGLSLGRWGPVAEGFVAWAVGLLALLFVVRWIGERG
jgi:ubiquinol-cytochrome c reductase cytochrome c subunit